MMSPVNRKRGRPRAAADPSDGTVIQSLDRAINVLKVVASGSGMSLTEIAETSGQSASTAYRILVTLQNHRIVEFDEASQLWSVGLECFRIGNAFLGRTGLMEQSRPVMQRLMTETGETANLAIMDGTDVVFVSQVETHEPIRAFFRPGTRGQANASGIGKAVLAYLPEARMDAVLENSSMTAFTEKTLIERDSLAAALKCVRARGWAVDDEERTRGMRCIAAPIFNNYGEAIAGISVSGPSVRVTSDQDQRLGEMVKKAAQEVTAAIGGRRPADLPHQP